MKACAARKPLLRAVAAAAGLSGATAMAAEWTFAPTAQLFAQAEDNPRLSASAADDDDKLTTAFGAQAAFRMQRRTETLDLVVQPRVGLQRYQRETDLDRSDQRLDMSLNWRGEHVMWSGSAGATRDTTATSELGNTGLTQLNQRHESADVSLGPTWQVSERFVLGSNAGWRANRYPDLEDSALANYDYSTASVFADYALSDRTSVSLSTSAGRLSREGARSSTDNASVRLQGRFAWSPLWTVTLAAGPAWVRAGQSREREQGVVYNGELLRKFEHSALSLDVSRSQSPSGRGVMTQLEEAGLNFTTQISERLSGGIRVDVTRRRDTFSALGVDLEDVRYGRASLNVAWRAAEHWQLSCSAGHSTQRVGSIFQEDRSARGYDVRLALIWSGDPYVN